MDLDDQIELGHLLLLERKCRVCGKEKNLVTDFYLSRKDPTLQSSYSYECKECVVKRTTEYNRKNAYGVRSRYLKRNYGISLEDYEILIAKQHHSCAICKTTEAGGKFNKRFFIDRDDSGTVRGLLCKSCKVSLAEIQYDIQTLKKMIKYLERGKS
tara:strand:- start:413 stop:880 length:468 start_codon:yes stop_codon:yes gene_type:complete